MMSSWTFSLKFVSWAEVSEVAGWANDRILEYEYTQITKNAWKNPFLTRRGRFVRSVSFSRLSCLVASKWAFVVFGPFVRV